MEESQMSITTKLALASILALGFAAPVQAQNPTQGDYYNFQPWAPQQVSPRQARRIRQGDYYNFQPWAPQQVSPGQARRIRQGDYYRPGQQ
jgi:hypothetical protein